MSMLQGYCRATTIHQILSTLFAGNVERLSTKKAQIFNSVLGYDGIKRTFSRSFSKAFVAGLAYLFYRGWVDVKWVAMEDASRSTLTNASEQIVIALNNTTTQFTSHPSAVVTSGLPIAAMFGFVPGLMMGFKKG